MDSPSSNPLSVEAERKSGVGFSEDGDIVTVRMSRDDWMSLLVMCGLATSHVRYARADMPLFRSWLGVINRMNVGNPNFRALRDSDSRFTRADWRRRNESKGYQDAV